MRGIPSIVPLLGAVLVACCGTEEPAPAPTGAVAIRFSGPPAEGGTFVSGEGDTLRLSSVAIPSEPWILMVRSQAGDSAAVRVDARTLAPLESYRRHRTDDGDTLVATIDYGAGFEGQARLILARGASRSADNLRTPEPYLDATQIPLTLAALDYSMTPDTVSFNYVSPFEQRAVAARLMLGSFETLRASGAAVPARQVRVEVKGLAEVYWYDPVGRLLRIEEPTRGRVWTRLPDDGGAPAP
ncbi:MAG TPA: hypothetical protein VM778_01940 [Gemmatimonadota bacterium]|nr:hypothetical protein [Gemmatimonadota bacterium]